MTAGRGSFLLTRIVFLRFLALIYAVAFFVALDQNRALIGEKGLLPADVYLRRVARSIGGRENWLQHPSLFWFLPPTDLHLDLVAVSGLALSLCVLLLGAANMVVMAALWALYFSIVSVGQRWYSFGWESQLLETGFLAIFLVPALSLRRLPARCPPPALVVWGYRWLIFRIMLGAGLIKVRGDQCWRDFTCMHYFYQTMPVPSPATWLFHASPGWFHALEVLVNHVVELGLPWLTFLPRPWRAFNGASQILFQVILISSGNLSFLNWLTIAPSIWAFDDAHLGWLFFSRRTREAAAAMAAKGGEEAAPAPRRALHAAVGALLAYLSWPVLVNLASKHQAMNTSFNQWQLVNTYGAFGSVNQVRQEVILQGTLAADPLDPAAEWLEFELKCKPGPLDRRPCLISPMHYRLDWVSWFLPFSANYQSNPWLVHMAVKLLQGDEGVRGLLAVDPFERLGTVPAFVRARTFEYEFEYASADNWWRRTDLGTEYMPPVSLDNPSVLAFVEEALQLS